MKNEMKGLAQRIKNVVIYLCEKDLRADIASSFSCNLLFAILDSI
jgi:hypothetical protein